MKKYIGLILLAVLNSAEATVLTFDETTGGVANGYGGLNWGNFYAYDGSSEQVGSGYYNGRASGNNIVFNAYSNPASTSVVSPASFTFNGAFFTAAWNDGLTINVQGFKDSVELYSSSIIVNTFAASYFSFNFAGIDSLVFSSSGGIKHAGLGGDGTHFAMDNFTFNEAIPEPYMPVLLGLGFTALRLTRRKSV